MRCILLLVVLLFSENILSNDIGDRIIDVFGKKCSHGENMPTIDSPKFTAYIFCDDGLGTQIGIILSEKGGGDHSSKLWQINHRFWQEGLWMTDVKQLVWSDDGNYLYVVTSEVYSDESLYELDLSNRSDMV